MTRAALLVIHTGRPKVVKFARDVIPLLHSSGFEVRALTEEAADVAVEGVRSVAPDRQAAQGAEVVVVLGGDGTFLRAAELAKPAGAPLLGVNLGSVGFLAEAEPDTFRSTVRQIVECSYHVEERLTLDVSVLADGYRVGRMWALNEASIERVNRERMLEVVLDVDDHPVTSFGCDGVLCATPTGSTAYAFSSGGPVVWPEVEAVLVVPNSAHALFARPLVVGPSSVIGVNVAEGSQGAVVFCDGRRSVPAPPGGRVEVRRGREPVLVARLDHQPFSDRLVAKFDLPVRGFRRPSQG